MSLRLDWCGHDAAKYAVEHWHYSRCMPAGKTVKIGVWESGKFIGVVIFSRGAAPSLGKGLGLKPIEVCELTRIALTAHKAMVSRIVAIALRFLKKQSSGLRLIFSYADPAQDHIGGVYQAGNWIYTGLSEKGGDLEYLIDGKWTHPRSVHAKFGYKGQKLIAEKGFKTRAPTRKYRYLMPLDEVMRAKVELQRKPYPKRAGSKANVAPEFHSGEGGATPTPALHSFTGKEATLVEG